MIRFCYESHPDFGCTDLFYYGLQSPVSVVHVLRAIGVQKGDRVAMLSWIVTVCLRAFFDTPLLRSSI